MAAVVFGVLGMRERRRWAALVAVLVLVILGLVAAWPRPSAGPDHVTVRVVNGPTVISTQVVPLR